MKHAAQNRNYGRPFNGNTVSPFESKTTGLYHVEKLKDGVWICMSYGDIDRNAPPGKEFEILIRRANALGGDCRVIRKRDGVIVFSRKRAPNETA